MRRFFWITLPFVFLILLGSIIWHYGEQKLSQLVKNQAHQIILEKINWDLNIDSLKFHLAPPGLEFQNLTLTPPKNTPWMTPLNIKSGTANLDFLNLMAGQIKIDFIRFDGISSSFVIKEIPQSEKPIEELPISEIFDALQFVPVKMLLFENTHLKFKMTAKSEELNLNGSFLFQTTPNTIHFGAKANLGILSKKQNEPRTFEVETKGALTPKLLLVKEFNFISKLSKLSVQGSFGNFKKVIQKPLFDGYADLDLNAEDLFPWAETLDLKIPFQFHGNLQSKGPVKLTEWTKPQFQISANLNNAAIDDFALGDIIAHLKFEGRQFEHSEITLNHPAGIVEVKEFLWNFDLNETSGKVDLKSMDLQKLFQEIHLKSIPVELGVSSLLECKGKLLKEFEINCQGEVNGHNLDVKSKYHGPPPSIVGLKEFSGKGTVTINTKEVVYDTSVLLPKSKGKSHGVINYKTGFNIDFEGDPVDLSEMSPLAGLKFEGQSKIRGKTYGDSSHGILEINLNAQNFWFDNFGLGSLEDAKVNYRAGHLLIEANKGRINESLYSAQLDVDLSHSIIKGLVEGSNLGAQDVISSLSRRVPIPFTASGIGNAKAQFEGPFQLGELSYKFEGNFKKGTIQGEPYDDIHWDWISKNGHVSIENNTIQKGNALITVNGTANPHGILDLQVNGNNFRLENSYTVSNYTRNLAGDAEFHMSIKNHILSPDVFLDGQVLNTTLGDSELPNSQFIFKMDKIASSLTMDLIGKKIQIDLYSPLDKNESSRLFVNVSKFDFANFLSLLVESPLRNEYESLLSLKLDLKSESNTIFQSTGKAQITEFYLSRGERSLRNEKPLFIEFDHGAATLKDFVIKGYQSEITATGQNFTPNKLNLNISGSLDLQLLQLFTPFLDDMSGPIKGKIDLKGSLDSPEIYGNIDLINDNVKIKGFDPLFEHLNSHIEFSQKRITLENIRGNLAGGTLNGEGTISLNGLRDVRVDIRSQLRNIRLQVPDHVQSSGSAEVLFSGNWFPYTLSGIYRVNQAFIDKDFTAEVGENSLKQSIYLPKNLSTVRFDPVILDLQIDLDKRIEIKNPQISGFLSGQIQVKGPPQNPILLGSIKTLPSAQLFFKDKIFEVQTGLVKFDDPTTLDPELYIVARSVVDKYEINLLLQGKSKNRQFLLTSQPPLPDQDIISLLALGVTTQKLDSQIESSQQAAETGYQLGSAIISANPLNKEIKQSLGLDVKFSSGFDDTKNVATPRVTVSKDIIPRKLTASASSSFSDNQRYDVRFQYLLNERLSTVVTYEKSEADSTSNLSGSHDGNSSIFGLDLEYKVEFK